jgi:hypothetical protein
LFEESWRDFLKDLNSACPISLNQTECSALSSRWEAIPIVTTDDPTKKRSDHKEPSANTRLVYNPSQSEDRWAEKFVATALQLVEEPKAHDELKAVADDIAPEFFRATLRRLSSSKVSLKKMFRPKRSSLAETVACSAPEAPIMRIWISILQIDFHGLATFLKEQAGHRDRPSNCMYTTTSRTGLNSTNGWMQTLLSPNPRGQNHRDIY